MAWNWGNALGGAASGATAGAGIGSAFGGFGAPIGAAIGVLGGGLAGLFGSGSPTSSSVTSQTSDQTSGIYQYLFGTPEGMQLLSRFSPEQQKELNALLVSGRENMQNPYQGFDLIKQDALNTFNKEIVPSLAHRFSVGGDNALSSGTLHSQLSGAGASLVSQLAAQQAVFGQNNRQFGLDQQRLGLSPQYGSGGLQQSGGSQGLIPTLTPQAAQMLTERLGQYFQNRQNTSSQQQPVPALNNTQRTNSMTTNDMIKNAISPLTTQKVLQRF